VRKGRARGMAHSPPAVARWRRWGSPLIYTCTAARKSRSKPGVSAAAARVLRRAGCYSGCPADVPSRSQSRLPCPWRRPATQALPPVPVPFRHRREFAAAAATAHALLSSSARVQPSILRGTERGLQGEGGRATLAPTVWPTQRNGAATGGGAWRRRATVWLLRAPLRLCSARTCCG
jgi:hypothetical protein